MHYGFFRAATLPHFVRMLVVFAEHIACWRINADSVGSIFQDYPKLATEVIELLWKDH